MQNLLHYSPIPFVVLVVACSGTGSGTSSSSTSSSSGSSSSSSSGTTPEVDAGAGDAEADAGDAGGGDGGGDAGGDAGPVSDVGKLTSVVGGENATCALYATGSVYCFGGADNGQLGRGSTADIGGEPGTMSGLGPVDLAAGAKELAMGARHVCALLTTGKVKCWGANSQGELGFGDSTRRGDKPGQMGAALPEVDLGVGRTAKHIAAGAGWSCAVLDDGALKCWGRNANGQLGLGVGTPMIGDDPGEMASLATVDVGPGRTVLDVVAGEQHTCARLDDESVKCWGANGEGQLGQGDKLVRGNKPAQMGASLPPIDLGTNRKAKAIWAGGFHTCARLDDASVRCWGGNVAGQLGIGSVANRGEAPNQMGDALTAVDVGAGRKIVAMHLGQEFSCALLDDETVKCFGNDFYGQLGYGDTVRRGDGAGEMGAALLPVDLGAGVLTRTLGGGANHVCAIAKDATLRCWGVNIGGGLGIGDRNPRGDKPNQMGAALKATPIP